MIKAGSCSIFYLSSPQARHFWSHGIPAGGEGAVLVEQKKWGMVYPEKGHLMGKYHEDVIGKFQYPE
jgi:hypothetical protein